MCYHCGTKPILIASCKQKKRQSKSVYRNCSICNPTSKKEFCSIPVNPRKKSTAKGNESTTNAEASTTKVNESTSNAEVATLKANESILKTKKLKSQTKVTKPKIIANESTLPSNTSKKGNLAITKFLQQDKVETSTIADSKPLTSTSDAYDIDMSVTIK